MAHITPTNRNKATRATNNREQRRLSLESILEEYRTIPRTAGTGESPEEAAPAGQDVSLDEIFPEVGAPEEKIIAEPSAPVLEEAQDDALPGDFLRVDQNSAEELPFDAPEDPLAGMIFDTDDIPEPEAAPPDPHASAAAEWNRISPELSASIEKLVEAADIGQDESGETPEAQIAAMFSSAAPSEPVQEEPVVPESAEEAVFSESAEETAVPLDMTDGADTAEDGSFYSEEDDAAETAPKQGFRERLRKLFSRREEDSELPVGDEEIKIPREEYPPEMDPFRASRYYSSRMPSMRMRQWVMIPVLLLLAWVTVGCSFHGGLPGHLHEKLLSASIFCLCAQCTVMLLGLDIISAGADSLFRGRPGMESMLFLAHIFSIADTVAVIVVGNADQGIVYSLLPSAATFFALLGSRRSCAAFRRSLSPLCGEEEPLILSAEPVSGRPGRYIVSTQGSTEGFLSRLEQPSYAESVAAVLFVPMVVLSILLALLAALIGGGMAGAPHALALFFGLCAAFDGFLSFPTLFAGTALRLAKRGMAVASWAGAWDIWKSRRLLITDSDLFPEGTVELTGLRLMDKNRSSEALTFTHAVLARAGAGTAAIFAELMERNSLEAAEAEEFTAENGGYSAHVGESDVRVGSLGFMYLNGIKVPDKLKRESAVYTAVDGELLGVFLLSYNPLPEVRGALARLRREHRKPVFALRDFTVDPLFLRSVFRISSEGFDFPLLAERIEMNAPAAEERGSAAALSSMEGLDMTTELTECAIRLCTLGRFHGLYSAATSAFGMLLVLVLLAAGGWGTASAGVMFLYMLLCLLPLMVTKRLV